MNMTEQVAFDWICKSTGLTPSSVRYAHRDSPDFLAVDGRGWEVKLLRGSHTFTMYERQWAKLRQMPNCEIILFGPYDSIPRDSLSTLELPDPPERGYSVSWKGYHVILYPW